MVEHNFMQKTKDLIDNLKRICADNWLGNDGNEFKIITLDAFSHPQTALVMSDSNFEYFCHKLLSRYDELGLSNIYKYDFWRLGVMKMLFFSVISINNESWTNDLIDKNIFDNFWALPNGPVESDFYNWINDPFEELDFESRLIKYKTITNIQIPQDDIKVCIENAVNSIPRSLFIKKTFELVDISHRYSSWKEAYISALQSGKRAWKMELSKVKQEYIWLALL